MGAGVDTLVDLTALSVAVEPTAADLGSADVTDAVVAQFERLRAAAQAGVGAGGRGHGPGRPLGHGGQVHGGAGPATVAAGVQGVIRTFARELAVVESRLVDVDPAAGADEVARSPARPSWRASARPPRWGGTRRGAGRCRPSPGRSTPTPASRRGSAKTATSVPARSSSSPAAPAASAPASPSSWPAPPGAASSSIGRSPLPGPEPADLAGAERRGRRCARRSSAGASTAARPRSRRPPPGRSPIARSGRPWRHLAGLRRLRQLPLARRARHGAPSPAALGGDPPRAAAGSTASSTPPGSARTSSSATRRAESFARVFDTKVGSAGVIVDAVGDARVRPAVRQRVGLVRQRRAGRLRGRQQRARRHRPPGARRRARQPRGGGRLGAVGRHRHGVARAGPRVRAPRHRPHRPGRRGWRPPSPSCGPACRDPQVVVMCAVPDVARGLTMAIRARSPSSGWRGSSPAHPTSPRSGTTSSAASTPSPTCRPTGSTRCSSSRGRTGPDRFYCRRGGFIDSAVPFDPSDFGIMPMAAAGTEPDQLLALADRGAGAGRRRLRRGRARSPTGSASSSAGAAT